VASQNWRSRDQARSAVKDEQIGTSGGVGPLSASGIRMNEHPQGRTGCFHLWDIFRWVGHWTGWFEIELTGEDNFLSVVGAEIGKQFESEMGNRIWNIRCFEAWVFAEWEQLCVGSDTCTASWEWMGCE
jgi:hypothetical protein